jgi:glycosyltransferase involved in cell wall biosynthesis
MKIINLSIDRAIFDPDSAVAKRLIGYGDLVQAYIVIAPANENKKVQLSDKVQVYGVAGGAKILKLLAIGRFVGNLLQSEKYDLITVQDQYYLALLGWWLAKRYKLALEIQVHGIEKYSGLRKVIANFVLPRADSVRTVSNGLRQRLVEVSHVNPEKIVVVPVYVKKIGNVVARSYESKDKIILLTIARLVPVKNIFLQLQAIANLSKENLSVELWIVGDGPEKVNLENESKRLGIEKYVKFWGWQSDTEKFYNQADIFLLTSYSEGWPLVIVEAAQYGLPIIMTDVGSAGELVVNNSSGLVVPVNDATALSAALKRAIDDNNLRQSLGMTAQQKASQLLSWPETLDLYKKSWEQAVRHITHST